MSEYSSDSLVVEIYDNKVKTYHQQGQKKDEPQSEIEWSFRATDQEFDGERILREADAAGVVALTIEDEYGQVLAFAKRELVDRMYKYKLLKFSSTKGQPVFSSDTGLLNNHNLTCYRYRFIGQMSHKQLQRLCNKLKRIENQKHRFVMRGITEV